MIVDTFVCMTPEPAGPPMFLPIRAPARSTSRTRSDPAVIHLLRHCWANSARSSAACAGTQPSECEMKWTQSSSAGNFARHASSGSSVIAMILALGRHLRGPLGEHLVAHVPQRREEPLRHPLG